jgi:diguanylate cyclase (GGDEF)-like protein
MITRCLRRYGLWTVIAAVTLISIVLSLAISGFVHRVLLDIEMPLSAWIITIGCPLLIGPTMSYHSFRLLLKLDQAHEQLRVISITDHLTGAANRRHFMERLLAEVERSGRNGRAFSLALLDIDNFKAVNDQHGHLAGDEVLRRLAQACMAQVREGDLFARFGGEEFAVLMRDVDDAKALVLAERLRRLIEAQVIEFEGIRLPVTVSVGIGTMTASTNPPVQDSADLVNRADQYLYKAKRSGRNRVEGCALE